MGNRVILWGVGVCLVLLLIELSVLAATGNWLAVSATVVALAGVVVATLVMIRRRRWHDQLQHRLVRHRWHLPVVPTVGRPGRDRRPDQRRWARADQPRSLQ